MMQKQLIYDLDYRELKGFLDTLDEPSYRADQIWKGLYRNLWDESSQFSNLPLSLREIIFERFSFTHLDPKTTSKSNDGTTVKTLFELPDGELIEAVLMKYSKRRTLCISTQAGCALGCVFCATGQMGFRRNLSSGEIIEQVLYYARKLNARGEYPTNVVVMGMGEPFHNYEGTLQAIERLNHPKGFNMGARRFTISTVGLVPQIRRFAEERRQINLAVSLHASDDVLRESMLPVNRRYPISDLMDACRDYVKKTGRRITFEWALIQDVNDTPDQAQKFANLLGNLNCHVNVIPLNPTQGYEGNASPMHRARQFCNILEEKGISCTIRVRRGIDIKAGCGQLAVESQ